HLHRIGAGKNSWTECSSEGRARGRRNLGRLQVHRPGHAIYPTMLAGSDGIDESALIVKDLDLQVAKDMARALVIRNRCFFRTILSVEGVCSLRPSALGLHPLHRRRSRQEACVFLHDFRRQRTERRDVVDDPDAATVRSQHEIVGARLNDKIIHSYGWEAAALVLRPALAAIVADEEPKLSSKEKQVGAYQVFFDHVCPAVHSAV